MLNPRKTCWHSLPVSPTWIPCVWAFWSEALTNNAAQQPTISESSCYFRLRTVPFLRRGGFTLVSLYAWSVRFCSYWGRELHQAIISAPAVALDCRSFTWDIWLSLMSSFWEWSVRDYRGIHCVDIHQAKGFTNGAYSWIFADDSVRQISSTMGRCHHLSQIPGRKSVETLRLMVMVYPARRFGQNYSLDLCLCKLD